MADNFQPKANKDENLAEAKRWLEKAIAFEGEGKSAKMIDMCLDRACQFESAAFAK